MVVGVFGGGGSGSVVVVVVVVVVAVAPGNRLYTMASSPMTSTKIMSTAPSFFTSL